MICGGPDPAPVHEKSGPKRAPTGSGLSNSPNKLDSQKPNQRHDVAYFPQHGNLRKLSPLPLPSIQFFVGKANSFINKGTGGKEVKKKTLPSVGFAFKLGNVPNHLAYRDVSTIPGFPTPKWHSGAKDSFDIVEPSVRPLKENEIIKDERIVKSRQPGQTLAYYVSCDGLSADKTAAVLRYRSTAALAQHTDTRCKCSWGCRYDLYIY